MKSREHLDSDRSITNQTKQPDNEMSSLLLFMLYGPYGVGHFSMEVSPAFSMDTEGIDDLTKNGKMNINSIKVEHEKDNDRAR